MIKPLHYFSGVTIAIFVAIHLLNHLLILHSEEMHIAFMNGARKIYRNPVIETVLLLAVVIQVISGIGLVVSKWRTSSGVFDWLHIITGLYLALFLIIHLTAVIIGRYKLHLDTNLYYGAGVMNMSPQKFIFIPYYSLSIICFFVHVACVHRIKMQSFIPLVRAEKQSWGIMTLGLLLTVLIVSKMSNIKMPTNLESAADVKEEAKLPDQ